MINDAEIQELLLQARGNAEWAAEDDEVDFIYADLDVALAIPETEWPVGVHLSFHNVEMDTEDVDASLFAIKRMDPPLWEWEVLMKHPGEEDADARVEQVFRIAVLTDVALEWSRTPGAPVTKIELENMLDEGILMSLRSTPGSFHESYQRVVDLFGWIDAHVRERAKRARDAARGG